MKFRAVTLGRRSPIPFNGNIASLDPMTWTKPCSVNTPHAIPIRTYADAHVAIPDPMTQPHSNSTST